MKEFFRLFGSMILTIAILLAVVITLLFINFANSFGN